MTRGCKRARLEPTEQDPAEQAQREQTPVLAATREEQLAVEHDEKRSLSPRPSSGTALISDDHPQRDSHKASLEEKVSPTPVSKGSSPDPPAPKCDKPGSLSGDLKQESVTASGPSEKMSPEGSTIPDCHKIESNQNELGGIVTEESFNHDQKAAGQAAITPEESPRDLDFQVDKSNWQGFCEIESDPAYFSIMLKEFGVRDVRVDEVFSLDALASEYRQVYGLVFLMRFRQAGEAAVGEECPEGVWFANQVATNSCATMAMFNIINNVPDLELGENLNCFREFTKDFTPKQRGEALMHFEFVKRIHNSFARRSEMLEADLSMKEKFEADLKSRERAEKKANRPVAKGRGGARGKGNRGAKGAAEHGITVDEPTLNGGSNRAGHLASGEVKGGGAKKRTHDEFQEDGSFHFMAFMPINGNLWKLDGMDKSPIHLGTFEEGLGWLDSVRPILESVMADADGDVGFNLMALAKNPLKDSLNALAENVRTVAALKDALESVDSDDSANKTFIANHPGLLLKPSDEIGLSEEAVGAAAIPTSVQGHIESRDSHRLIELFQTWAKQQDKIRSDVREAMRRLEADEAKASLRRGDYGDAISEWIRILVEDGHIQPLAEELGLL